MIAVQVAAALAIGVVCAPASATLLLRSGDQDAALSVDGFGGNSGLLQADVPVGSTVVRAFLYSADIFGSGLTGNITFNGSVFAGGTGSLLVPNTNPANTEVFNVTSIVAPIINAGPGGVYNFTISEGGGRDGEVLVVVYRNASTVGSTAIILDGELALAGDTTVLNFASPYVSGNVFMSLASSFSYNGDSTTPPNGQVTIVDVKTSSKPAARRLTSCAGGNDDGGFVAQNGFLMTAGGVGDNPANPDPFCSGGADDDELYNLGLGNSASSTPFLTAGDTSLTFATNNPSFNDNVFGLFFSSALSISQVDQTPIGPAPTAPISVPLPGTSMLMGLGLLGLGILRKYRRA